MKQLQKKAKIAHDWMLPGILAALVLSVALSATFIKTLETARQSQDENRVQQLSMAIAHELSGDLEQSMSATYALAALVRQGQGQIDDFEMLAPEMLRAYEGISSMQLLPNGVVAQSYPPGAQLPADFSPLEYPAHASDALQTSASTQFDISGPFKLQDGTSVIIGRYPVYLPRGNDDEYFWGQVQVVVHVPELLERSGLNGIVQKGYSYQLWREYPPNGARQMFAESGSHTLADPIVVPFPVPDGQWSLSIAPTGGWNRSHHEAMSWGVASVFCGLVVFIVWLMLREPQRLRREVVQRTRELRRSEIQYRSLFDQNPVPMLICEKTPGHSERRLLDANIAFLTSYGYSKEELCAMTVLDLHPEAERQRIESFLKKTHDSSNLEHLGGWHHQRKNGDILDVEMESLDVQFHGRPARLIIAMDITDRLRAEEALRKHHDRLQSVLAHFPDGISVIDAQTRIIEWNEQFCRLLDLPADFLTGEKEKPTMEALIRFNAGRDEYGHIEVETLLAEARHNFGRPEPFSFKRIRPNGTVLEVRCTPLPDGGFISSHTDITQRTHDEARLLLANRRYEELNADLESRIDERTRRLAEEVEERRLAEKRVQQSADLLRVIIDTMPAGIMLWDKNQRLLAWNEAFTRQNACGTKRLRQGMSRTELRSAMAECGEAPPLDNPDEDWDRFGVWDRSLPDGRIFSMERIETSDGGRLVLRTDVTSLRRSAEMLARNERMASLGSLVAGIAHEISTPVGNALMVTSTLSSRIDEFKQTLNTAPLRRSVFEAFVFNVHESGEMLQRNLARAARLIHNFKQIAVDQSSDQRRTFDLSSTLHAVHMALGPRFKRSPFTLEISAESDIALDSYPGALGQVITNLVDNALLHAFVGRESGRIRLFARRIGESHAELVCSDNGIGIPPEGLSRIFDPFYTTRLGQGGSGLGLPIVLNLVRDLLGGSIHVESTVNVGTQLFITIPRSAPNKKEAQIIPYNEKVKVA